jgi:hypothetical protein
MAAELYTSDPPNVFDMSGGMWHPGWEASRHPYRNVIHHITYHANNRRGGRRLLVGRPLPPRQHAAGEGRRKPGIGYIVRE